MIYERRNWPAILEDVSNSGLSVAEYARTSRIPYSTLISHCRNAKRKSAEQLGFIRVTSREELETDQAIPGIIRICLHDVTVEVGENFSKRDLAAVLEVVDARSGR